MGNKYIFLTGAAGGFGKIAAQLLVEKGYYVFAADIEPLPAEIVHSEKVIPLQFDLTDAAETEKAVAKVRKITNRLAGLVNIAALFDQFPLAETEAVVFDRLIHANLFAAQYITAALFPLLYEGRGRIVNLSSQSAPVPIPLMSYGFSKRIFDDWNTQLRIELALLGMDVIVIRAGGHKTPFLDKSAKVLNRINENSLYSGLMRYARAKGLKMLAETKNEPQDLAKVIVEALTVRKPKKVYNVNVDMLFQLLSWLPAGLRERLLVRYLKKQRKVW